ncbi:hypothetical protein EDD63_1061, partial [Breznakia blatticola]
MKETTMKKWQKIINDCEASGMRKSEYLEMYDIPPSQYYKYRKLLAQQEQNNQFEKMQI